MDSQQLSQYFSAKQFERLQAALASMTPERRDDVIRSFSERAIKGPKPGDEAPDFELPLLGERARKVRLSSFRAKKPVALIFGSFT